MRAFAKINLTLGVLYQRADGYHALDTVMQQITLCDLVSVRRAKETSVRFIGADVPADNTVTRAVAAYEAARGEKCPVRVRVKKRIPDKAGLGGGSADAAVVLRALFRLYPGVGEEELYKAAARVGADVPFCLMGGLCRAQGVGEILTPYPAKKRLHLVVIKPETGVSTAALFGSLQLPRAEAEAAHTESSPHPDAEAAPTRPHPDTLAALEAAQNGDAAALSPLLFNALLAPAEETAPEIGRYISLLLAHGALGASMSGSGSAVFGLYKSRGDARAAARKLEKNVNFLAVCATRV